MKLLRQLRLRPKLLLAIGVGLLLGFVLVDLPLRTRCLLGWNAGVWLYLLLALRMMSRADHLHLQRNAIAQADGISAVLLLAFIGASASLGAITLELSQVHQSLGHGQYLLLALSTVTGSWLLLPVEFAFAYASRYHAGGDRPHGLEFPGDDPLPDYTDFMYFAVTLAATSQTSDVAVSARPMRRLVLVHAALSFVFNTCVLALTINILAGIVS